MHSDILQNFPTCVNNLNKIFNCAVLNWYNSNKIIILVIELIIVYKHELVCSKNANFIKNVINLNFLSMLGKTLTRFGMTPNVK